MRISAFVIAVILGCALCQTPTPAPTNYCSAKGTFCSACKAVDPNKSCDGCGKGAFATDVAGLTGVKQCVAGSAQNCAAALSATTCSACNAKFAIDTATNLCVADATVIADCGGLTKTGTTVTCQGCTNGKALSTDSLNCTTAATDLNCLAARIVAGPPITQTCDLCKLKFAKKGTGLTCEATTLEGCAVTDTAGTVCTFCNTASGWWFSDVNKCTASAYMMTASLALVAFFFSN